MSRKAMTTAASVHALQGGTGGAAAKLAVSDMGQAGDKDSLARLNEAMRELKAIAIQPVLRQAIEALQREDFVAGCKWAIQALEQDETNGVAWYLLGISRERAGDYTSSVKAYEAALKLLPEHAEIANDLGRLAYRMGMLQQAEKLFRHYWAHEPENPEAANNLASVIRDQGRTEEAIDLLKSAAMARPEAPMLWNTLGTIMIEEGHLENAGIFFAEAMRLDPKFAKARYNASQCKLAMGDPAGGLMDCDAALKGRITADDRQMIRLARSTFLLALGRLEEGWTEYEARLSPQFADVTHFLVDRPRWKPQDRLEGKTLLVIGEQGLGDEVLFANVLEDVLEALGPDGKLLIAVEPRLVALFQRSFPQAEVTAHATFVLATRPARGAPDADQARVDMWTPMGCLLREFRRTVAQFPDRQGFLTADPARVAHWRRALEDAPAGRKVGLLWKSGTNRDHRKRFFSPFEQWAPVLTTPGVTFVNLQYGDCSAELAQAERDLGVSIWAPPGIDLKDDLDDVAALSCAMDLVIGFSNASFNLAAACGAPAWLLTLPNFWTSLGTGAHPWYPQSRVFTPPGYGQWTPMMQDVAGELRLFASEAER